MTQAATPRIRHWRGLLVVLLVLAVVGAVAVAGGFERRSVRSVAVPAGTELDSGNLVLRLDSATVQYRSKTTADPWQVVVTGAVRNPNDESLAPISGAYGNLLGIDRASDQYIEDATFTLGATDPDKPWTNRRQVVPPGDSWMEIQAAFTFAAGYQPAGTFEVGVVPMEFTAQAILGLSNEKTWNPDSFRQPWTVTVPLTRLPDTDY